MGALRTVKDGVAVSWEFVVLRQGIGGRELAASGSDGRAVVYAAQTDGDALTFVPTWGEGVGFRLERGKDRLVYERKSGQRFSLSPCSKVGPS